VSVPQLTEGGHGVAHGPSGATVTYFWAELNRLLEGGAKRVCEIGVGSKPAVPAHKIETLGLEYVGLDTSQQMLDEAPAGYRFLLADILDSVRIGEIVATYGPFDLVVSRWTAEHVPDGRRFHQQVFDMLAPGGVAIHLFSTLYSLPFLINRLLSPSLSKALLFWISPNRKEKFDAHYSWCRGPSRRQIARLDALGFSVERYLGSFGHGFYHRLGPVDRAHKRITRLLVAHPLASLTSSALVVLRRRDLR
jgi:SAM-dependent methyltransferase